MLLRKSSLHVDFISSYIRSQVEKLSVILKYVEDNNGYEDAFIEENLRSVEQNTRQLRKFYLQK
ncbi:MAG: hypothetical protein PHQ52_02320 [Candidatus Omnitrophica bacterium]|nr:hypothetical protein [Candidatus Omnitrophota bacterium]